MTVLAITSSCRKGHVNVVAVPYELHDLSVHLDAAHQARPQPSAGDALGKARGVFTLPTHERVELGEKA